MSAGAESEARIELEDHFRRLIRLLARRRDPEPLAEAHRAEILEPFAFPGAVLDVLDPDGAGRQAKYGLECGRSDLRID